MKEEKAMKKKLVLVTSEQDLKKKGKKEAKLKVSNSGGEETVKKSKKKEKKRKAVEIDESEEEVKRDTGSELVELENKKKKKKKVKLGVDDVENTSYPKAVSKFRISAQLQEKLKENGIEVLFPIQATIFYMVLNGEDLVGHCRTSQGKTLAFVLPILQSLINKPVETKRDNGCGRSPSVLVLLPSRELAKQVFADFDVYGRAVGLSSCLLYEGDSYQSQEYKLKRGVDVVVGTPNLILDHINRQNIEFCNLHFCVLDEAVELMRMGFLSEVELILRKVKEANKVQKLLFSAPTLSSYVEDISARFLKPNKKTIYLAGNEMSVSNRVRHILLYCIKQDTRRLLHDIISCYSSGGRTIIFTETKNQASELCGLFPGSRALLGDNEMQQSQREAILAGFRNGEFLTLVATDIAAYGQNICNVQLIIQCESPRDVETYIHRSGRTGRAGNAGVAVMLYDYKLDNQTAAMFLKIERQTCIRFEYISAPIEVDEIVTSVVPAFMVPVKVLSAEEVPAKAVGFTEIKTRSLLTLTENHVALLLHAGRPMHGIITAKEMLRSILPEDKVELIKGLNLTADGEDAVFDVVQSDLDLFIAAGQRNVGSVSLEVVKELPELQDISVMLQLQRRYVSHRSCGCCGKRPEMLN